MSFIRKSSAGNERSHVSVTDLAVRILDGIPDDKHVYHGYPWPGGLIDHVVITKHHGIFAIEMRADFRDISFSDGRLIIDGEPCKEDLVGELLKKAVWLRADINEKTGAEVWVNPLLVFPHLEMRASLPVQGVRIVCLKYLIETIQKHQATEESMAVWLAYENDRL